MAVSRAPAAGAVWPRGAPGRATCVPRGPAATGLGPESPWIDAPGLMVHDQAKRGVVMDAGDGLLTREELLRELRVAKDFLYTPAGRSLPTIKIGSRVMIRRAALGAWLR